MKMQTYRQAKGNQDPLGLVVAALGRDACVDCTIPAGRWDVSFVLLHQYDINDTAKAHGPAQENY